MFYDQQFASSRCEWGQQAVIELGPHAEAIVIVDVLSFTTCVDIAVSRGASVLPYRWRDETAAAFAAAQGAELASHERRFTDGFSLSPTSLLGLPPGARLVLPSPNGATLCALAEEYCAGEVYAACLRNAQAVGEHLRGRKVLVVPAGERWADGTLRPAIEDWLGAGAVLSALGGHPSPEAELTRAAFEGAREQLPHMLAECSSGRELHERGFGADVALAAELGVSRSVPRLRAGVFSPLD